MARRKKANEFPFVPVIGATTFYSTGTASGDIVTTQIVPADAAISHSTIRGITNGTGTSLLSIAWFTAASAGGTQLTKYHTSTGLQGGPLYDLDAAAGVVYSCDYFNWPPTYLAEGARMFLNANFDTGGSGAGTFALALFLVL